MTMVTLLAQAGELVLDQPRMTAFSWTFMFVSIGGVCSLTFWCFSRVLRGRKHFDPDGIGPEKPPQPGTLERHSR